MGTVSSAMPLHSSQRPKKCAADVPLAQIVANTSIPYAVRSAHSLHTSITRVSPYVTSCTPSTSRSVAVDALFARAVRKVAGRTAPERHNRSFLIRGRAETLLLEAAFYLSRDRRKTRAATTSAIVTPTRPASSHTAIADAAEVAVLADWEISLLAGRASGSLGSPLRTKAAQ